MSRVSFTEVWDRARGFIAKEWSLLVPVALAWFAVPTMLLSIIMPQPKSLGEPLPNGPWMLWFVPVFLLSIFGSMTLAAMTLVPAVSVGEALRRALARLPTALGALGLLIVAMLFLSLVLGLLASIAAAIAGWGETGALPLATMLLFAGSLVVAVRLAVLWPAVIDGEQGPFVAVRRSLTLTMGKFWRLFGLLLLAVAVTMLLTLATRLAGGSVLLILGDLVGSAALGIGLANALNAIVLSFWLMMVAVYVAFLYRALGDAEGAR
jgi:hypothetical protein